MLEEVWNRGVDYLSDVFGDYGDRPTAQVLAVYFTSFHSVLENTTTKANIVALLHNQLPSIREKEGRKLFECIDFSLGKMQKPNTPIHSVTTLPSSQEFGKSMNIITSNADNDTKQNNFVYKDMTLAWW